MISKIKLFFYPYNVFWKLIRLRYRGMLYEEGWFESACFYKSIDKNKNPIPWWTYSFNDFFLPYLNKNLNVYEYGCGNSTLYLSNYVKHITSVEHDEKYYNLINSSLSKNNITLKFVELDKYGGKYSKSILEENQLFDLIIIDGRDRINSTYYAIKKLKDDGIIILDDSQRKNYLSAIEFLKKNNFKHIFFSGVSAGTYKKKYTSLFYKDNNWMGL